MPSRHTVIVCNPSAESFSMSIAERYASTMREAGDTVSIRDLYAMDFNPVLSKREIDGLETDDVKREKAALSGSDVFVFVYPIWFGAPPAMLKGYIERVLAAGFTYREMRLHTPQPLLKNKLLISFTTSGSMRAWLEEKGVMMSLQNLFDHYLADVFDLKATEHYHFDGVSPDAKRWEMSMHLNDVEKAARHVLTLLDPTLRQPLENSQPVKR